MRFKVLLNEQEAEVEVTRQGNRLRVSYGDQTYEATIIHRDGPHFVLEVEEEGPQGFICRRRIRAAGYQDGDQRQLWANGRLVNYRRLREGAAAAAADHAASLSPSIPAVVSEVLVSVDERVSAGQKLILLESMKMILPIQAPYDGVVTAVNCQVGQAVQPGQLLVDLEEETG
ncbi:MAG: acetyl-CoA carboxylase biotin carboxyl carrier protein subunit [Candidatus Promineifilaceae bacterium]|nr:acetyl-CoA carboxylase biotin carboxyl carrier protein subunit [Candidatus Promineifilaceae bacterium]